MSAVQKVIDGLQAVGVPAEWHNTGGGCMAISVGWGPGTENSTYIYEILITDREDAFEMGDGASDDNVSGFYAAFYAGRWEMDDRSTPDEGCLLYQTSMDAGYARSMVDHEEESTDLTEEVEGVVAAVAAAYDQVRHADHIARRTHSTAGHWFVDTPGGQIVCEVCGVPSE